MESFEHLLYQLHLSYLQARKNKRNTHNQLRFEMYQEEGIIQLAKDLKAKQQICLSISTKPTEAKKKIALNT